MPPLGPFKLVTVNNVPERAKRLIGRVVVELQDKYTITHEANCASIDEVRSTVERVQPDILFCASMWTPEESARIISIGKSVNPALKTHVVPQGLQAKFGPDAIVDHVIKSFPEIIKS